MGGPLGKWFKMPSLADQLRAVDVREDLIRAAEKTAFGRQSQRTLPAVARLLNERETVLQLLEGRHRGEIGILVLTDLRVLFSPKATGKAGPTIIDLSDVTTVHSRNHRGQGVLEVSTADGMLTVDQILGTQAETMAGNVGFARSGPPKPAAPQRDPLVELAELRALHHAGVIDDVEFQIRKQHLFGQI